MCKDGCKRTFHMSPCAVYRLQNKKNILNILQVKAFNISKYVLLRCIIDIVF